MDGARLDLHVQRHHRPVGGDHPGVDVVDVGDAGHGRHHLGTEGGDVQPVGRALQQDVRRHPHQAPGAVQDEAGDGNGKQRVDGHPARQGDDHCGGNGGDGAQHVAEHMERCPADVDVAAVAAVEDGERGDVDQEASDGHRQHQPAEHLDRREQPADRLDSDPDHDRDQRHAVDEGGEHLEAMIAVGAAVVVAAPADPEGGVGQGERSRVGGHVPGVGEERQRAGDEAASDLHDHERAGQRHRPEDAPLIAGSFMRADGSAHDQPFSLSRHRSRRRG